MTDPSNPTVVELNMDDVPNKIRVYALAKLAGVTSKEMLTLLRARGVEVKSASSSVTREDASTLALPTSAEVTEVSPESPAETSKKPVQVEIGEDTAVSPATGSAFSDPFAVDVPNTSVGDSTTEKETPVDTSPQVAAFADPFAVGVPPVESTPQSHQVADTGVGTHSQSDTDPAPDTEAATESATHTEQDSAVSPDSALQVGISEPAQGAEFSGSDAGDNQFEDGAEQAGGFQALFMSPDIGEVEEFDFEKTQRSVRRKRGRRDDTTDRESNQELSESGTYTRRRQRRRKGDDAVNDSDDSVPTEIHERDARSSRRKSSRSTPQGINGSTRLEAKRQRRRDGRDNRRRRSLLSEAEFLARRESVERVMVVREKHYDSAGATTQIAVLEDKVLVEHFVATEAGRSMVGNVYVGVVQNVLPSMEAAFIDIGEGRNGVLYAGEVNWDTMGLSGKSRKIEQALNPGDMVLVQATKDPVGQKGARLTTQISLAGRFLVFVPNGDSVGISRKLPRVEARRLKTVIKAVAPDSSGVIVRTAAEGVESEQIEHDIQSLVKQWETISERSQEAIEQRRKKAITLYEEPDLLVKVVRDLFNEDFSKLVIQGEKSFSTVHEYVAAVAPDMAERIENVSATDEDVFHQHRVDEQLSKALNRMVWLPSGGTLVIDRTEAMTVIDVNTGRFTGSGGNLEETITKNNLEAAEEIVRQLRLRDIGGMIIIDFIDMVLESNRELVLKRLTESLGRDRTRHQVSEVTSLGLVQLTRKKMGTGLLEAFSVPCPHCRGEAVVIQDTPVLDDQSGPGPRRGKGGKSRSTDDRSRNSRKKQDDRSVQKGPHPVALAMSGREDENASTPDGTGEEHKTEEDTAQDTVSADPVTTHSAVDTSERKRSRRGRRRRKGQDSGDSPTSQHTDKSSDNSEKEAVISGPETDRAGKDSQTNLSNSGSAGPDRRSRRKVTRQVVSSSPEVSQPPAEIKSAAPAVLSDNPEERAAAQARKEEALAKVAQSRKKRRRSSGKTS